MAVEPDGASSSGRAAGGGDALEHGEPRSWPRLYEIELSQQAARNERHIARAALAVTVVAGLVALYMLLAVHRQLGWFLLGLDAVFIVYFGVVLPRLLSRPGWLPWLQRIDVSVEVSGAALISLIDYTQLGGAYAFTSTPIFFVFIAVSASGLRLRWSLVAYAGALGALEQLGVWWLCRQDISDAAIAALPSLGPGHALQRSLYILATAMVAGVVTQMGHRVARRVAAQHAEQLRIRQLFGEYISDQLLERVLAGHLALAGERREVTVLFADIRGFTTLSSACEPEVVVAYLNRYFAAVSQVITAHGGLVNKFMGDGLLAVFGAPEPHADHAAQALGAAAAMVEAAAATLDPAGQPTRIGVGLHTGPLVLGSIGSPHHRDYTVIGDTVNLASRLEGLTREWPHRVLLSAETRAAAGARVSCTSLGPVTVKGREQPVELYALDAPSPTHGARSSA